MPSQNRQLAAILFTDIVGYTAVMQQDEQKALAVTRHYIAVLNRSVEIHHGQISNDYGDGSLCTFPSVINALRCAIEVQQQLQSEPKVPLRIGLHSGEVFFENSKVMGDSVNVASRIQSLGQANTILFSKEIFDKIKNQPEFKSISLGQFEFKNVDEPMEIFALVNEGLKVPKREEMSGKLKEMEKKSTRKKIFAAIAIFLLLAAGFFIYKNLTQPTGFTGEKTIAVLPFENTGADNSEEYISDGITQDIISNLSKISSLQKVIGWFSVRAFKKTTKTLNEIAKELGVAAIISGSIQKNADKMHVIAELTEVNTKKLLWNYDSVYSSKDLLTIQSTIAGEIVSAMKASLTAEEKKNLTKHYTDNIEAYKFYRKGRIFWDQRTKESFDSSQIYYNKAIELDPDYALAYSGLADLYIYNQKGLLQTEAIPFARNYALKALLLDSTLSEALTTIGFIQSAFDYDWVKSKNTLQKAITLNPNYPTAHLFYGNLLQYTGESTEQGISEIKKALSLDPLSRNLNYVLGRNYYYAHKYDSAFEQLKKTIALDQNFNLAKGNLVYVLLEKKNYPAAFDIILQLKENGISKIDYYKGITLSYAYAASGDKVRAKEELEKTLVEYPDQSPFNIARVYIALRDYEKAITSLEKAYEQRDLWMYALKADPTFNPIRNELRFKALMKRMNLE